MKVRFWGTRGSIPVSVTANHIRAKLKSALSAAQARAAAGDPVDSESKIESFIEGLGFNVSGTFGGHSSCLQIETGGAEHVLCDMGSGARPLGQRMLQQFGPGNPQAYHVFMSHLHWDHIMGFPFFTPAYIPGNRVHVYGCHAELEQAFRLQQSAPGFPVPFSALGAAVEFHVLETDRDYEIAGLRVRAKKQRHGGDSYGWRFESNAGTDRKVVVYSTDSEHRIEDFEEAQSFVEFFRAADLVVFDAMYSLADAISVKADWGHSSNVVGVELCQQAGVRRLCMFHHEPAYDDDQIQAVLNETRRFEEITREGERLEVLSAWDGLEITI